MDWMMLVLLIVVAIGCYAFFTVCLDMLLDFIDKKRFGHVGKIKILDLKELNGGKMPKLVMTEEEFKNMEW